MKNVLWISFRVPYDSVAHAGGKIHNFYLKKLFSENKFRIKLISFYNNSDIGKIDLDKYGIDATLINSTSIETNISITESVVNKGYRILGVNRYLDIVTRKMCLKAISELRKLNKVGYCPDVVILQWTQIVSLLPEVKRLFPDTKIVSIEEDVTFLTAERRRDLTSNKLKKAYFAREKECIMKIEKNCLEKSDLVILNNKKDEKILFENNIITKTWVWTPYFQNMASSQRLYTENTDILFYGAMDRPENWMSAIWFIENVFAKLKPDGYKFIIIGNKPDKKLLKYHDSNQIRVLGFVDDITPYFEKSLCLVAPLVLGAGVKIKILEAMSSGIPVLTNGIGIEGIYAKNNQDYYYCDKPDDYISVIKELSSFEVMRKSVGNFAKAFIKSNYDYNKDAGVFCEKIKELSER